MNAKALAVMGWALLALAAQARDWTDIAATPFVDPLLARPPVLDVGKVLPGDSQVHPCASAQDIDLAHALSLANVVDIALCRNPQVQSAWASIKVQAAALGEAKAAYLPTFSAGVSRTRDRTRYPDSAFTETSTVANSMYNTLSWRILDFGGRAANRQSANALLDAALASHDATLQKILSTVVAAYFDAQTTKATLLAKQNSESIAQQTLATAKRREEHGAGSQSDTLQATTALAKTRLDKSRAQGVYAKALSVLVYTLGLPVSTDTSAVTLTEDLMDSESELHQELSAWLSQARENHPAVLAAKAQLESAKQKLKATRSEGLPTIDMTYNLYRNGRPNQGLTPNTLETLTGFTLNLPFFDGFSRTYKVSGAEAQIEVQEAQLRDVQNQVLSEVVKAHADALAALNNLTAAQELLTAAQNALASVQRKYDKGAADILEMLTTQTTLSDANQQRIATLADWRSARLRLLASTGMLGHSGVASSSQKVPPNPKPSEGAALP